MITAILFLTMTLLGAFGCFCLKSAQNDASHITSLLTRTSFYLGALLYFLSAVLNIYLLKFIPFVIFLPLTAITYVWTLLLSRIFLKEKVTAMRICGLVLIIIGIAILV